MNHPPAFRLDSLDVKAKELKAIVHMGELCLPLREFQMQFIVQELTDFLLGLECFLLCAIGGYDKVG
jgi:hypothetical protein